ncbi:hypothetical protein ACFFX0_10980 [Citricoccus parietis]|uniref:Uncharacterized protein n=1 Tax=Citricoccus parietis TaxID=592307 RepID=A0ABV5FZN5_9MICC
MCNGPGEPAPRFYIHPRRPNPENRVPRPAGASTHAVGRVVICSADMREHARDTADHRTARS